MRIEIISNLSTSDKWNNQKKILLMNKVCDVDCCDLMKIQDDCEKTPNTLFHYHPIKFRKLKPNCVTMSVMSIFIVRKPELRV